MNKDTIVVVTVALFMKGINKLLWLGLRGIGINVTHDCKQLSINFSCDKLWHLYRHVLIMALQMLKEYTSPCLF